MKNKKLILLFSAILILAAAGSIYYFTGNTRDVAQQENLGTGEFNTADKTEAEYGTRPDSIVSGEELEGIVDNGAESVEENTDSESLPVEQTKPAETKPVEQTKPTEPTKPVEKPVEKPVQPKPTEPAKPTPTPPANNGGTKNDSEKLSEESIKGLLDFGKDNGKTQEEIDAFNKNSSKDFKPVE